MQCRNRSGSRRISVGHPQQQQAAQDRHRAVAVKVDVDDPPAVDEDLRAGGENAVTTSGVPRVTAHDLRHTAASLAVSAGANVKAVQRMLGHASAAMTLDIYADLFDDDLEAVATELDAARTRESVGKMWADGHNEPR